MRVAIVHDYLAQAGGAERVVVAMHGIWPDAPIYTSVYDPRATLKEFQGMDIRTSFLQRMRVARTAKTHKLALPLFPAAFEHFDLTEYDVVVSSSSGFAKGVITGPDTCHICYCHTPARFAWRYHEYINQGNYGKLGRRVLPWIIHGLRTWDVQTAQRVDEFVVNSFNVAKRVRKYYGRESEVLYPPVETGRFHIAEKPTEDYLLVVSRLIGYKRMDLAVEACTRLGLKLKVVGGGPDLARLKAAAGPTVEFLGRLPDGEVENVFANCRAFLFPGEEDFGIAPVEAMAAGRPVVAFRAGGATETVIDGETGLFFDEPTVESLMDALRRLDTLPVDPQRIRAHAQTFDISAFQARLRALVEEHYQEHRSSYGKMRPRRAAAADHLPETPLTRSNGDSSQPARPVNGINGHQTKEGDAAIAAAALLSPPTTPPFRKR
jgi:glycosyltransferase involved in cell wall biosynthesis